MIRPAFAAAFLVLAVPAFAGPAEDLRAEFRAVLYAPGMPHEDSRALKGSVLYPYVEAARLRAALAAVPKNARDAAVEASVQAFVSAHAGEPVAQPLFREWLMFLGTREAWTEYLAAVPADTGDASLRCLAVSAHLARQEFTGQREAALTVWQESRDVPDACESVFAWLEGPGRLTDEEVERRAIFAAQNRLKAPKPLARLLAPRRALMQAWDRLMADPARELERVAKEPAKVAQWPATDIAPALIEAYSRATRRSAMQARALLAPLEKLAVFDDAQRVELHRLLAMGLAYDFDVEAIGFFAALPENVLDVSGREWRVRAALYHEDWAAAERWLAAMPPEQRDEPRWRYWRARVLAHQGRAFEARALFEQAASAREYYAFLAAERLGRKPDLRPGAFAEDKGIQARIAARPAMMRAKELLLADFQDLAALELRYALRDDDAKWRGQAARIIWGWGWYAQALKMFSDLQLWDDLSLRFPMPFDAEVDAASRVSGVPASWLYMVLRTESLYDARAVSPAGALGLLQLKLDTARQVAKRAGLARPTRDDLFAPAVNLALGARYIAELQARTGGRLIYTLAAYNAGPDKLGEWLPSRPIDADIWIENIPYNETRGYVQRALSTLVMTEWRRSGKTADLLPLLQPVGSDRQDASP